MVEPEDLKRQCGWWMPAVEEHMPQWMMTVAMSRNGRMMYQGHKIDAAIAACRARRVALDIGAHIGTWSWYLAQAFDRVYAWEPVELHRACFTRNVLASCDNVKLYDCALGEDDGLVVMRTEPSSTGDTRVAGTPKAVPGHAVQMRTLDGFADEIVGRVDLVKVDCEGYEYFVLRGGERLLAEHKPVVVVEQKRGKGSSFGIDDTAAVKYLEGLGARVFGEMSGDYFMRWAE